MSAPSTPVDSYLPEAQREIYYVLERESAWKTEDLSTNTPATWTEILTAATFESANSASGTIFLRLIAPTTDLVYILAAAKASGESNYTAYLCRSTNRGATWAYAEITDGITAKDYTVTHVRSATVVYSGSTETLTMIHERIGDDDSTYNPYAIAWKVNTNDGGAWADLVGDTDTVHDFSATNVDPGPIYANGNWLLGDAGAAGEVWLTDYFGGSWSRAAGINRDMPKSAGRVKVEPTFYHSTNGLWAYADSWVFWNKPSPVMPAAMAVARTNHNWIYVGLEDKVVKSEDGGFAWATLTDSHGAYDICVDPQAAGAIYYWANTGTLKLMVAGVITAEALETETPFKIWGRLARSLNSGRLWAIKNGTTLEMRNLGSWSDQKTDLATGRGLNAYLGDKLILVDNVGVYISDDGGVTVTDKTGGWATFSGGVNAQRIIEAP